MNFVDQRRSPVSIQHVQDKVLAKLAGWQCKSLNLGGRRVLVRSVLSSLLVYLLTVLKPPKKFIKSFDKVRRCFLWAGHQQLHGGKCKVSWARLQRPIKRGGLGDHEPGILQPCSRVMVALVSVEVFGHAMGRHGAVSR